VRALVIGADGFVGRHLVAHLAEAGDAVSEAVGPRATAVPGAMPLDVRDAEAVTALLQRVRPEAVYHLAAVAYGPDAGADLPRAIAITVTGTANVLAAAKLLSSPPTVLVPGSAEVYGAPSTPMITEATCVRPVNLYGATKVAQEAVALAFHATSDVPVIATRSFNHIGPGQRDSFAIPSFARQLCEIAFSDREPELRVGNLESVRDFTDVRDVVVAYRLLVAGGHAGRPINIATGRGVAIGDILERLIALSGLEVQVTRDPDRVRRTDPPRIVGDAKLLRDLTGWQPRWSLDDTLADVWGDARARFGGRPS
jgi:GDP-4-dehydro-6-deoxy-D-mannose reductase